jgi:hypothetical protein
MSEVGMFNFGIVSAKPAWRGWDLLFRDGARVQLVRAADVFRTTVGVQQPFFEDDFAEPDQHGAFEFDS